MEDFQLRQTYINKFHNYKPPWILRMGLVVIFLFLAITVAVTGFIKFPDIVYASAEITTLNPPVHLVANSNCKIDSIIVNEGQKVKKGAIIMLYESTTKLNDTKILQNYLQSLNSISFDTQAVFINKKVFFNEMLQLGDLQAIYSELQMHYGNLKNYYELSYNGKRIKTKQRLYTENKRLDKKLLNKKAILNNQYKISKSKFIRDSLIYQSGGISSGELEQSKMEVLSYTSSLNNIEMELINRHSYLTTLSSEISDLELQDKMEKQQLIVSLKRSIGICHSTLEAWKQQFLVISPINGSVSFTNFWSVNQHIKAGEVAVSIIPNDSISVKARIKFPIQNSGKVREGLRVNIKLHNYPYQEFGMIVGKMGAISSVPNDFLYNADVILAEGLVTSYGENLPLVQELMGDAEILTDDISLLMRFFNPLRAVFDK